MKRALIIGVAGQDGYYLTRLLVGKGYAVYGVDRTVSRISEEQKTALSGVAKVELANAHLLVQYVSEIRPDEIYYLAAHHFSSQGEENRKGRITPFLSVNLIAPSEVLEFLKNEHSDSRFFYAASAHIFGVPEESPQTEMTKYCPETPYAISKSSAIQLCRYYRKTHGIYTVAGILYNHESPRRPDSFVTTQIANAAACAARGESKSLILRDLNAVVDWGSAEDYVKAMWCTLQQSSGDEYIISTGIGRTVMDFARTAFEVVGFKAEDYIFQQKDVSSQTHQPYIGDNSKIRRGCDWQPSVTFEALVREMVEAQLSRL